MKHSPGDHLSSSLTDLMTSLMVIFVLLLVATLNSQATKTIRSSEYVMNELDGTRLFRAGEKLHRDGDVIVVVVPRELMSFREATAENGGADLSPQGRAYLRDMAPKLSSVLCRPDIRGRIDTIVVEGHSDKKGFGTGDPADDDRENLELSQKRSMSVVAEILDTLGQDRGCFLDLLSATGRGDAHPINVADLYSPENRRVEFRIRVRPDTARNVINNLRGSRQ
jgi:chemotaxis protein MotB